MNDTTAHEPIRDGRSSLKVLLGKPGLDGHFRGIAVVAASLMEAGIEVVYTGQRQTPESIVYAARDEDVHAIGLNIMTGAAAPIVERILELQREVGMSDVSVFVGGILKPKDRQLLRDMGIEGIFGPGTSTREIVNFVLGSRERGEVANGR